MAPAVTSFTPTRALIGDTVIIHGTGFTAITSVSICGAAAAFTVNSTTQITATVPNAASGAGGLIVVTNAGGSGSHSGFTPLHPGPWIQPADTWFDIGASGGNGGSADYQYSIDADPQPDIGGVTPTFSVHAGGNGLSGQYEVDFDFFGVPAVWRWTYDLGLVVVDTSPTIDGGFLPGVPPSGADLAAPDVEGFDYETPGGTALGPVKVRIGGFNIGGLYISNNSVDLDPTLDIFQSHALVARVPAAGYTSTVAGGGNYFAFLPDIDIPADATMTALTPIIDALAARDIGDMVHVGDNVAKSAYVVDVVEIDADLSDLDDNRRYAIAGWIDRAFDGTTVSHDPDNDQEKRATLGDVAGALTIRVWYRPPRYRLLYDIPVGAPPTVRQRQIPGQVRQRQHGSVVRQRQVPR